MPKVSIIIPVYNNAPYLDECLDSVIRQTVNDIEIICVNDASTDNSLEILKKYEKLDKRIKVINLEKNGGVSNARNIALDNINGKYVCFLDSDDFIEIDFCKFLINNILVKHSDLACGGHCKINKFNQRISKWLPEAITSSNVLEDINLLTKHRNVTQKLFKTQIIKTNNIRFNTSLHYMEDALFLITYLTHCTSISGVQKMIYNVRINENSLCRNTEFVERRKIEREKARACINKVISSYKKNK